MKSSKGAYVYPSDITLVADNTFDFKYKFKNVIKSFSSLASKATLFMRSFRRYETFYELIYSLAADSFHTSRYSFNGAYFNNRGINYKKCSLAEQKALDSLRDIITEREWRRYINCGFLSVRGYSGLQYLLFRDQRAIRVYDNNKPFATICIHTEDVPPTDHIISLKFLLQASFDTEESVWDNGNIRNRMAS